MTYLNEVRRAARALETARDHRDRTIVAAREDGETVRAISEASGMSIQGIVKLLKRQEAA